MSNSDNTKTPQEERHSIIGYHSKYGRKLPRSIHIPKGDQSRHFFHKHSMAHHICRIPITNFFTQPV